MKSPRLYLLSDLPDDVIPDIVSHYVASTILTNKQAIQLGLLSKDIFGKVQKRPALMFDDSMLKYVPKKRYEDELNYLCNTLRRYDDENIHLETFSYKFTSHIICNERHRQCIDLATKKNLKKLNLVRIDEENCSESYHMPVSACRVESLEQLSLKGWHLWSWEEKSWPNLKRLCLDSVKMDSDLLMSFKKSCPSIETLEILRCCSNKTDFDFRVPNLRNLKQLTIRLRYATQKLKVTATPKLESIACSYDQIPSQDSRGNFVGTTRYKCPKDTKYWTLRSLSLDCCVGKGILKGRNKFKFLRELSISNDPSLKNINLYCPQLKIIRMVNVPSLKEVIFDVPKVVLFEFECDQEDMAFTESPRFTFSGNPNGWISRITLRSRWGRPIECGPIECGAKWHWP